MFMTTRVVGGGGIHNFAEEKMVEKRVEISPDLRCFRVVVVGLPLGPSKRRQQRQ